MYFMNMFMLTHLLNRVNISEKIPRFLPCVPSDGMIY